MVIEQPQLARLTELGKDTSPFVFPYLAQISRCSARAKISIQTSQKPLGIGFSHAFDCFGGKLGVLFHAVDVGLGGASAGFAFLLGTHQQCLPSCFRARNGCKRWLNLLRWGKQFGAKVEQIDSQILSLQASPGFSENFVSQPLLAFKQDAVNLPRSSPFAQNPFQSLSHDGFNRAACQSEIHHAGRIDPPNRYAADCFQPTRAGE